MKTGPRARRLASVNWALPALLVVLASFPRNTAAASRQDDAWGEAVEGVQLRVVAVPLEKGVAPTKVDLPRFQVQIRNQGTRPVTFNPVAITLSSNLEVDGEWYSAPWGGSCCPAQQTVPPGGRSAVFDVVFRNGPYALSPGSKALALTPGTHSIRLRSAGGDRFSVTIEGTAPGQVVLVSNLITIELPAIPAAVERQALVDEVSRSGSAGESLRRLRDKYPDALFGAIQSALRASNNATDRGVLISWLEKSEGDEVTSFLRGKLGRDTEFASRSAAATILFRRGDPLAVPASIAAWQELQALQFSPASIASPGEPSVFSDRGARFAIGGFITILAQSGDPKAIDALARNLRQAPLDVRMSAVGVFLGPETGQINVMLNGGPATLPGGEAGLSIERLLVSALDDTEQKTGMKGTAGDVSYAEPRVCDMAALVFATRWPAMYSFRWSMDLRERDTQIAAIRAAWRSEHPR